MNRKWIYGAGAALFLFLVIGTMCWSERGCRPAWSSESDAALEAVEDGFLNVDRHYYSEAASDFRRALDLDPQLAVAKLYLILLYAGEPEQHEHWWAELKAVPPESLSPRERFLVGYFKTREVDKDPQAARVLLDEFLAGDAGRDDPFALTLLCSEEWALQRWESARACYRRALEFHPSSVDAQSRLGLIAMAEGDFEAAEEGFRTSLYVAPDQATPHDSLGQLQTVRGRYEEAAASFGEALEIRSDFCSALHHRFRLYQLWGRADQAAAVLDTIEGIESCDHLVEWGAVCNGRAWVAAAHGEIDTARQIFDDGCLEKRGGFDSLAHRLASEAGDFIVAVDMERALEEAIRIKIENGFQGRRSYLETLLPHMQGVRLAAQGKLGPACKAFQKSDDLGLYWGLERSFLKLQNQGDLLRCYEKTGHAGGAAAARERLRRVNPAYLESLDADSR